jgi:hypothetical protein
MGIKHKFVGAINHFRFKDFVDNSKGLFGK